MYRLFLPMENGNLERCGSIEPSRIDFSDIMRTASLLPVSTPVAMCNGVPVDDFAIELAPASSKQAIRAFCRSRMQSSFALVVLCLYICPFFHKQLHAILKAAERCNVQSDLRPNPLP